MQKLKVAAVKTIYMSLRKQGYICIFFICLLSPNSVTHSLVNPILQSPSKHFASVLFEKAFKYLFQKNVIKAECVTFLIYLYKDG